MSTPVALAECGSTMAVPRRFPDLDDGTPIPPAIPGHPSPV